MLSCDFSGQQVSSDGSETGEDGSNKDADVANVNGNS